MAKTTAILFELFFFPIHTYDKVNLQIKQSKITNDERIMLTIYCNKSYMNVLQ